MKKKVYSGLLYFFTIFLICQNLFSDEKYQELDRVVAIVEKEVITEIELANAIKQVLNSSKNKNNSGEQYEELVRDNVLDQLIQKSLIEQYAAQFGIKVEQKKVDAFIDNVAKNNNMTIEELAETIERDGIRFGRFIDNIRYELILKQIKNKEISTKINVSDFEIESQLRKNAVLNPDVYNLSHILIQNQSNASEDEIDANYKKSLEIYDLLKAKKSFEDIAIEFSDDSSGQTGGNIGWKKEEDLPELFVNELSKINEGEITNPFRSPNGFHILKINEKKGVEKKKVLIKQTKLRHIIIKQNEITPVEEITKRLNRFRNLIIDGSETFENLAKKYSEDGSAAEGGDLG